MHKSPAAHAHAAAPKAQRTVARYRTRGLECLCGNLRMAMRAVTQVYDAHLAPLDLGANQLAVLWAVTALQPVNMATLSERLALDQTTLSRNVAVLVRRGLLAAAPGDDARHKVVSVTAAGAALFAQAMPHWERAQDEVRAVLGATRFLGLVDTTLVASTKVGRIRRRGAGARRTS